MSGCAARCPRCRRQLNQITLPRISRILTPEGAAGRSAGRGRPAAAGRRRHRRGPLLRAADVAAARGEGPGGTSARAGVLRGPGHGWRSGPWVWRVLTAARSASIGAAKRRSRRAPSPAGPPGPPAPTGESCVERSLPLVPEEAAAVALASFRSMLRAPEVKMALATNVVIFAVFATSSFCPGAAICRTRPGPSLPAPRSPQPSSGWRNCCSTNSDSTAPAFRRSCCCRRSRRRILLGKNLAVLPLATAMFALYLALATALAPLRIADMWRPVLSLSGPSSALGVLGNAASILVPYRIAAGSLRPTKVNGSTQLADFFDALAVSAGGRRRSFCRRHSGCCWTETAGPAVGAVATPPPRGVLGLAFGPALLRTSGPLGRLFERRQRLQVVTQEVESGPVQYNDRCGLLHKSPSG